MKIIRKSIKSLTTLLVLSLLSSCDGKIEKSEPGSVSTTWVIKNALVYDGLGSGPKNTDVRIENGIIVRVGLTDAEPGVKMWDANGLALSPGFIDPHSHHDTKLMENRAPKSAIAQGITTIVSGLDGGSSTFGAPFVSIANSFAEFEKSPAAINLAYFAPHNTYRSIVMKEDFKRPATGSEVDQMKQLLRRDLEAGALGLSTGLEYEPSLYSTIDEVIELAKVAAEYGGRYTSHMRSEDVKVHEAIDELLTIAREADIPANISHIKLAMYELYGQSSAVLDKLNEAREQGLNITADIYPYDGWQAPMAILMPSRDYTDRDAAEYALESIASPSSITITYYEGEPTYIGKTLAELANERKVDPEDLLMQLLQRAEKDDLTERVIGRNMGEEDIQNFMKWPHTAITSDGGIDDRHPRGQGAFSRVLARYVREKNVLVLAEAIRKMTSLSARNLGITNRGTIAEGYAADLVLFDPNTITDHATFEDSLKYSTGIEAVWVNGELVFEKGKITEARPGRAIRRE